MLEVYAATEQCTTSRSRPDAATFSFRSTIHFKRAYNCQTIIRISFFRITTIFDNIINSDDAFFLSNNTAPFPSNTKKIRSPFLTKKYLVTPKIRKLLKGRYFTDNFKVNVFFKVKTFKDIVKNMYFHTRSLIFVPNVFQGCIKVL